ncbi:MAG: YIP1 family protein [Acidobacteriota bacterium]|nr:YIP1 family protein [Acidobacteriota bacterium]
MMVTDSDVVQANVTRTPGLVQRLTGVLFSPRVTFTAIVHDPRPLGALVVVCLCVAAASGWLVSTPVGQQAVLEQQVDAMESFGVTVSDETYTQLEARLENAAVFTVGGVMVWIPILTGLIAGLVWTVGYVIFGSQTRFKAMYAVVTHAGVVNIVQQMFVVPLNYARGAMGSPATVAAFFPMLEEGSFPQRALSLVDLFIVWQLFLLAVGVGLLFKRRTGPIATTFYALYAVIAVSVGFALSRLGG